jgi:hypothetical protein
MKFDTPIVSSQITKQDYFKPPNPAKLRKPAVKIVNHSVMNSLMKELNEPVLKVQNRNKVSLV